MIGPGAHQRQIIKIFLIACPPVSVLRRSDGRPPVRFRARSAIEGRSAAAADLLMQAIELAPNFTSAWFTLGGIREELGEHRGGGWRRFRRRRPAIPVDRHGAALQLMRLGAEPVSGMPQAYVQTLFDQYAPRFETSLVGDLGYRGPALLFKARCCRCDRPPASRRCSSAPSISAAAPGCGGSACAARSIISSASICRRA